MSSSTDNIPQHLDHLQQTTSFFHGEYTAISVTATICCALAIYNAIELLLLIFTTFRRYGGLYFWSLVVATVGVLPYTVGFMIEYFHFTDQLAGEIISTVGWPMMVTGQSVVLYSRLGILLGPSYQNILKAVKWMIIVDGVVLHVTTSVVMFGAYNANPNHTWAAAYKYIEMVQMTIFTIQEFILSGLYIWRTVDILNTSSSGRKPKRIMRELFSINVLIVFMDVALLVVEYQHRHVVEQAIKVVIYSVKLKLEFAILNKLINISQRSNNEIYLKPVETTDSEEANWHKDTLSRGDGDVDHGILSHDFEKGDAQHVEHAPSGIESTCLDGSHRASVTSRGTAETVDQQKRRQNIEMDDYAEACRAVAR